MNRTEHAPWWPGWLVFTVALAIRLFFLTLVPEDALRPSTDWELDSIAMSIVTRGEFADPYVLPTGPTAHLAPIPPAILALIYKVFGITMTAGIAGWLFRMLAQSAIWGLLPWIGERTGLGWKAGLIGGIAGALFPLWLAHGEAPAAVLLGLLVVAVIRRWESVPRPAASLLLGAAFGISFHVQPVFLLVLLGYLGFELWWRSDRGKGRSAALVTLAAFLACVPWGVRNYRAFDAVFFVRSNFGLELRMGNHEGAAASIDDPHFRDVSLHPRTHPAEAVKVREWGEVPYMRESGDAALEWIGSNPGTFARLTAERVGYFWLGPLDQPGMVLLFGSLSGADPAPDLSPGLLPGSLAAPLPVPDRVDPVPVRGLCRMGTGQSRRRSRSYSCSGGSGHAAPGSGREFGFRARLSLSLTAFRSWPPDFGGSAQRLYSPRLSAWRSAHLVRPCPVWLEAVGLATCFAPWIITTRSHPLPQAVSTTARATYNAVSVE